MVVCDTDWKSEKFRVTKIYQFKTNQFEEINQAGAGEIVALAGLPHIKVSQTITDPNDPQPIQGVAIDPPTIAMKFSQQFFWSEGEFVTSTHLKDRLYRETLTDVA